MDTGSKQYPQFSAAASDIYRKMKNSWQWEVARDFVERSVQESQGHPLLSLGCEHVSFSVLNGETYTVEVKIFGIVTATNTRRCFAWLDPFSSGTRPRVVTVPASPVITSSGAAVRSWLFEKSKPARK